MGLGSCSLGFRAAVTWSPSRGSLRPAGPETQRGGRRLRSAGASLRQELSLLILEAAGLPPPGGNPCRSCLSLASGVSGRIKGGKGETLEDSRLPAEAHGPTPSIGRLLKGASRHLTLRHTQHQQRAGPSQPSLPAKENSSIPAPGPWWCRAIVPPSGVCGKELGIDLLVS